MTGISSRPGEEILAALASPDEPPAGGAASALASASAAALLELSAGLAAERLSADAPSAGSDEADRFVGLAARAGDLRRRLISAADDDVDAYGKVARAGDAAARADALVLASEPPLTIAECAAEVAEATAEVARAGAWSFRADAMVAGELALAGARGAAELVTVNLAAANVGAGPDDPRSVRARAAVDRAETAGRPAAPPTSD
ncbi:MAG: hypothetical protein EXQ70_06405 [Solirubrobacterales bacterium]|nr:hypothetical protein [Solirubrobacterales bacterium]